MGTGILDGKTAIVTGASQGIGLATARALARDGANVVITGRNQQALATAGAELAAEFPKVRVEIFAGDAGKEEEVNALMAFAHGLANRLDILVSTVGDANMKPLLMLSVEEVFREFERNFMTAFLLVRYGVPHMERGGAIVCISSVAVTQTMWGHAVYSAAKAAVERFVRCAAYEFGGAGIRINAVRPGLTVSEAIADKPGVATMVENFSRQIPMRRVGKPADVASAVRFLAGPESGWVTGQIFSADGGQDQGQGPDFMDEFFGAGVMQRIRAGKAVDSA